MFFMLLNIFAVAQLLGGVTLISPDLKYVTNCHLVRYLCSTQAYYVSKGEDNLSKTLFGQMLNNEGIHQGAFLFSCRLSAY